jgi:hypothetical protein
LGHRNKSVQRKLTIFETTLTSVYVANFEFYGTDAQPKPARRGVGQGRLRVTMGEGLAVPLAIFVLLFHLPEKKRMKII